MGGFYAWDRFCQVGDSKQKNMQKNLQGRLTRGAIPFLAILFILSLGSCSRKVSFTPSREVPAAKGWVRVKHTESNYEVKIRIDNLAPATNLSPPQHVYIVWVDTESDGIKRLGSMQSSRSFLSSALKASLDATMPYKPIRVTVTAESEPDPAYPGMYTVLRTGVINVK